MIRCFQWCLCVALLSIAVPVQAEGEQSHAGQVRTLLIPAREAVISSQIAGRITEIKDSIGMAFKKDEPLVRFDCTELSARMLIAEAELESVEVTLKAKQELFKLQSAGETEVALAAAAVSKAKAQTVLQKNQMDYCEIRAPFDGSVVKVAARNFQSVNQSQPLLEIVSRLPPKTRMNIPSHWLKWLKAGSAFRLKVDETGRSYKGHITAISNRVDAVSQTVEAEGDIEDARNLVAGMSGFATFSREGKQR